MAASANTTGLPSDRHERVARARLSLRGLSVGDAFGERFFGVTSEWTWRLRSRTPLPPPWPYTDDTAMAVSLVAVLDAHGRVDQDDLARRFAEQYADDPHRGYGPTAHDVLRSIHAGRPWRPVARAAFGGQGSMGNGSAMRVGPLGAYFADDLRAAAAQAAASAEVTHAHPEGAAGAIAVAVAAAHACRLRRSDGPQARRQLLEAAIDLTPDGDTRAALVRAAELPAESGVRAAAEALGNGVPMTCPRTVPFCLWCATRHLDSYVDALWTAVSARGDIDTTCAIVGAIAVMATGPEGIPQDWLAAREPLPSP